MHRSYNKFYKTHCLGNDFILIDSGKIKLSRKKIIAWCDRHTGIGADGVLILHVGKISAELFLFNADGSSAEKCFNGLRCAAYYLYHIRKFPSDIKIKMSGKIYPIKVFKKSVSLNINLEDIKILEEKTLKIKDQKITGYFVDVGNPHFVVLQKTNADWLNTFGKELSENIVFPHRANIEFVWQKNKTWQLLVYERGCGITLSCGTGAAACAKVLHELNKINQKEFVL